MRKLVFAINITLDGCCDHTKGRGDDETLAYHTRLLRDVDVVVFGRKTYELMVPFWPDIARHRSGQTEATNEFARAFGSIKRIVVFSRTLESTEAANTRIVRANLQDEILKLKHEHGRNILTGGVSIPSQLIELDLVDEYRFLVQPAVAGEGTRLLEGVSLPDTRNLTLVESQIFTSGTVALRYLKQSAE